MMHHWLCQVELVGRLVTLGSGSELAAPVLSVSLELAVTPIPTSATVGNLFRQHTDSTSNEVAGGNSSLASRSMDWHIPGVLSCLQSTVSKVVGPLLTHVVPTASPHPLMGYADLSKGKHPQLCSWSFLLSLPVCSSLCPFSSLTSITLL